MKSSKQIAETVLKERDKAQEKKQGSESTHKKSK